MKIRNIITALLLSFCIAIMPSLCTTASDYETASGIIEKCSLKCSESDGMLNIYAKTQASGIMDRIGFVNIIIQKSSDMENWSDEKNIGDFLESDRKYYTLSHTESVQGGFYYRAVCTHFADGVPFRSSSPEIQTADNISKAVWIDTIPSFTIETTAIATTTATTTGTTTVSTSFTAKTSTAPKINTSRAESTSRKQSITTITTTVSTEKSATEKKSEPPFTSSGVPLTAFTVSAFAVGTAVLTRKKFK